MLFFVNNVFKGDVGGDRILIGVEDIGLNDTTESAEVISMQELQEASIFHQKDSIQPIIVPSNMQESNPSSGGQSYRFLWIPLAVMLLAILYLLYLLWKKKKTTRFQKQQIKSIENRYLLKIDHLEKSVKDKIHHQDYLGKELKFRQNEMVTMAMSIIHKNEFLNNLKMEILHIKSSIRDHDTRMGLNKLSLMITQDLSIDRDRGKISNAYQRAKQQFHSSHILRLFLR